jgi:hypothetical protein
VADVHPYDVLKAISHHFVKRLRSQGSGGIPIRIMCRADLSEQALL